MGEGDKPLPFQDLMRRFRRVHDVLEMVEKIPLKLNLFDVLYLDGDLLIDEPYSKRRELLEKVCPVDLLVPRLVTGDEKEVGSFLDEAIEAGHEGLMAKRLDSRYTPGARQAQACRDSGSRHCSGRLGIREEDGVAEQLPLGREGGRGVPGHREDFQRPH
jgi:ATP-dependent DNA ligase